MVENHINFYTCFFFHVSLIIHSSHTITATFTWYITTAFITQICNDVQPPKKIAGPPSPQLLHADTASSTSTLSSRSQVLHCLLQTASTKFSASQTVAIAASSSRHKPPLQPPVYAASNKAKREPPIHISSSTPCRNQQKAPSFKDQHILVNIH